MTRYIHRVCLSVGSVEHAAKLAKALRDVRYTKMSLTKVDAAFAMEVLKILYGMPELRFNKGIED